MFFNDAAWKEGNWKNRASDAWAKWGRDFGFHIWTTFSFASSKGPSRTKATRIFEGFQEELSREFRTHISSFYGMEYKKRRRGAEWNYCDPCWSWHIHSGCKYQKLPMPAEELVHHIETKWGSIGDVHSRPFCKGEEDFESFYGDQSWSPWSRKKGKHSFGAVPYTASHRTGKILLISCPERNHSCKKGSCYVRKSGLAAGENRERSS